MQVSGASTDLAPKVQSQGVSDSSYTKSKNEPENSYQIEKIRCPCGSSLEAASMIKVMEVSCSGLGLGLPIILRISCCGLLLNLCVCVRVCVVSQKFSELLLCVFIFDNCGVEVIAIIDKCGIGVIAILNNFCQCLFCFSVCIF